MYDPKKDIKKMSFDELIALRYDLALDLYRQRARQLALVADSSNGNVVEWMAYKVFGTELMASTALMLNLTYQLDPKIQEYSNKKIPMLYPQKVVTPNRTRSDVTQSPPITEAVDQFGYTDSTELHWTGAGYDLKPSPRSVNLNSHVVTKLADSAKLISFINDTTWKSRNPLIKHIPFTKKKQQELGLQGQGELQLFNQSFDSPEVSMAWDTKATTYNDVYSSGLVPTTWSHQTRKVSLRGASATVNQQIANDVWRAERDHALALLAEKLPGLIANCLPSRKIFQASYQIGELKDLSQTLRGTLASWKAIESVLGRAGFFKALSSLKYWTPAKVESLRPMLADCKVFLRPDIAVADAFLTFKFGWQSMYQAVDQLVRSPEYVAKDINTLIERNGKMTTLSTQSKIRLEDWGAFPPITPRIPSLFLPDPRDPFKQNGTRMGRIRCVVNSGIKLPDVDPPRLRQQLWAQKWGLVPSPSDLYNLVPWTWLVDWVFGVSQYVRLAEEVVGDPSLINYALASYKVELKTDATLGVFKESTDYVNWAKGNIVRSETFRHTAQVGGTWTAQYELRVDAGHLSNVKLTSGKGLSLTQEAIIGALLSKYLPIPRK